VVLDEVIDSGDEVFYAWEAASANFLLRNESEPSLDLVEPGRVDGGCSGFESGGLCASQTRTLACLWVA
jgi:hypothetical protein